MSLLSFFGKRPLLPLPSKAQQGDPYALLDFVFEDISHQIHAGISTRNLETRVQELLGVTQAVAYFKGYWGYPSIMSTPVNHEVVHTPPTERKVAEGDILTLEFGLLLNGLHAFLGWTFPVGIISAQRARLLFGAHAALNAGLGIIRAGARVSDISEAIHDELDRHGFVPSREFVGYQIGVQPTMDPQIPAFRIEPGRGLVLKSGIVLAVIVIAHAAPPMLRVMPGGWTVFDANKADSAYFSALVRVTENGCERLTQHPAWQAPRIG